MLVRTTMKNLVLILFASSCLVAPGRISSPVHAGQDRTTTLWSTVDWFVNNEQFNGNPFDIIAAVTFQHDESNEIHRTAMFYTGRNRWCFRFTPTRPGRWSFVTQCDGRDGTGRNAALHEINGIVEVSAEPAGLGRGFITHFGNKWGWSGSRDVFVPQYVMGRNLDAYYDRTAERIDEAKIDRDIREFVIEHGFTGFHLQGRGRWFNLTGRIGKDPNPDPRTYEVLETVIRKVYRRGGACHIWMWGSDGKNKGEGPRWLIDGPMNAADKRNLRYLAARLGPLPGWTMGYGYDTENLWASPEELDAWKEFIESHSGWDHLLGSRVGYDEKGLWGRYGDRSKAPLNAKHNAPVGDQYMTWLGGDYMGYTSYRPLYDRYVKVLEHRPEKPSFDEDRFRLRNRKEWKHKDYSEELTIKGLWHSAMAGGVANIWGNLLPDDNEGGSQSYDHSDVDIKHLIKTYAAFFRDKRRFRRDFVRDNALADPRKGTTEVPQSPSISVCLRNPDMTNFIFYKEQTAAVGMDLSGMKDPQPAVAVDTQKAYEEIDLGVLAPEKQTWRPPYPSTWAIAVGEFE